MIGLRFRELPENHQLIIITHLTLFHNDTKDFSVIHIRESVQYVYPLYIFLYAVIALVGTISNVCLIVTIVRRRLYRDPTCFFICNLAISDIIKCLVVLPISLWNVIVLNWVFGSFLCYFIPMLQCIPIYASMLTFLLIAVYRYRFIFYPQTSRIPRLICSLGIWVLTICVVLPFSIYITYFDFEKLFGPQFSGTGLCVVNIEENMQEYLRGLFIVLYVLPLTVIAFLYIKISFEIKVKENPLPSVVFETVSTDERSHSTLRSGSDTPCPTRSSWAGSETMSTANKESELAPPTTTGTTSDGILPLLKRYSYDSSIHWHPEILEEDDGFDPRKEKQTQKYLISIVTLFAICIFPLEIMKLVKHGITETLDNTGHFDLAFLILIWIGVLPTCITPILFVSWFSGRPIKDKLRGYLKLNNRRRHSSLGNKKRHSHHERHNTITSTTTTSGQKSGHHNEACLPDNNSSSKPGVPVFTVNDTLNKDSSNDVEPKK